jgi:hypothetical protein
MVYIKYLINYYFVYIDAHSVFNQRLNTLEGVLSGNNLMSIMDFSLLDLYGIQQI